MLSDSFFSSPNNFTDSRKEALLQNALILGVNLRISGAEAVFAKEPLIDPGEPNTSDFDFLTLKDVQDLSPKRLTLDVSYFTGKTHQENISRLPATWLDDPMALAGNELAAHKLTTYCIAHALKEPQKQGKVADFRNRLFDAQVQPH